MVRPACFVVLGVLGASLAASQLGCSQASAPAVETAAPSQTQGVVIAQIVTHDAKVALVGGGRDLRVVVRKLDGAMVADGVTLAELRARDPELYTVVTSAFAQASDGTSNGYVDATLDLGHLN
jgi:hypothetical protein